MLDAFWARGGGGAPRFWYAPPPPPCPPGPLAKGQRLLAMHLVAPKAPKNFFSFPLPILSTLHPNTILEPNLDSNAHPNPQPTPNPTPKLYPRPQSRLNIGTELVGEGTLAMTGEEHQE